MYNDYMKGRQGALVWLSAAAAVLVLLKMIAMIHAGIFIQDLIPKSKGVSFRPAPTHSN
jgi:hypothetical protein